MTSTTTTPTATTGDDGIKWGVTPDTAREIIAEIPDAGQIEVYGFDINRRVKGWLGSRNPIGTDVEAILVHDEATGVAHTIDLRAILGLHAPGVA